MASGGKEQEFSVLSVGSMRPDIGEAQQAPDKVKMKLVYRDLDELDTGMQKVQPLPFLDEEIERFHAQIRESVPIAQEVKDQIPQKILEKVDHVIKLAHEGQTSLFKASQLLEVTSDAYQYARFASKDTFGLQRKGHQSLDSFDETFKKLVECRIHTNMTGAEQELSKCFEQLKSALDESRRDVHSHQERAIKEDQIVGTEGLVDTHGEVEGMIKVEKSELEHIKGQCITDIHTIDGELTLLQKKMKEAREDYLQEDKRREQRLEKNRTKQQELREELRRLESEESTLVAEGHTGKQLQDQAKMAEESAAREVNEWKGRIEELKRRTDTSLTVMEHMTECTDWIMNDAKSRKRLWKEKLSKLELESLLSQRDAIMASGCLYLMVVSDSRTIVEEIATQLIDKEKEKKTAARRGFGLRVKELADSIQQYSEQQRSYSEEIAANNEILATLREELEQVDLKIKALRHEIRLDTLEDRFLKRKEIMDSAYQKDSVEGVKFSSHAKY